MQYLLTCNEAYPANSVSDSMRQTGMVKAPGKTVPFKMVISSNAFLKPSGDDGVPGEFRTQLSPSRWCGSRQAIQPA